MHVLMDVMSHCNETPDSVEYCSQRCWEVPPKVGARSVRGGLLVLAGYYS